MNQETVTMWTAIIGAGGILVAGAVAVIRWWLRSRDRKLDRVWVDVVHDLPPGKDARLDPEALDAETVQRLTRLDREGLVSFQPELRSVGRPIPTF